MIHESVTIDEVVALLNEALALDSGAVSALVAARVPCNEALANHPTIQSGIRGDHPLIQSGMSTVNGYEVGILGVLNGLFGIDERGWGAIGALVEGDGQITQFERLPPMIRAATA